MFASQWGFADGGLTRREEDGSGARLMMYLQSSVQTHLEKSRDQWDEQQLRGLNTGAEGWTTHSSGQPPLKYDSFEKNRPTRCNMMRVGTAAPSTA
jgi:hypothetical protein